MLMQNKKQAFTLVELIVVITIIAILWTIAFISLQWYSTAARDSTRISNLSTMKTSLELFHLDAWKYPTATDGFVVTYSWTEVWTQWTFWTTTFSNVTRLDKIPTDPLTEKEYTYSTTKNKQEYQLAWLVEWDTLALNNSLLNQTNAWDTVATAVVTWNYNNVMMKTLTWANCSILSVPSIISNQPKEITNLEDILTSSWLVYNWYNNLPSNYGTSKFKTNWWFEFSSHKLVAYSDDKSCTPLYDTDDNIARVELITNLQTAYTGTIIANSDWISNITKLDISDTSAIDLLSRSLVNNSLGGSIVASTWWNSIPVVTGLIDQTTCELSNWYWVDAANDNQWDWFCISPRIEWNWDVNWISWNNVWTTDGWPDSWIETTEWNAVTNDQWWRTWYLANYSCKAIWSATTDIDITDWNWDTLSNRMKWLTWFANFSNNQLDLSSIDWVNISLTNINGQVAIPAIYIADCIDWERNLWIWTEIVLWSETITRTQYISCKT